MGLRPSERIRRNDLFILTTAKQRKIIRTPYFHLYQHFSRFVEPGAHLAASRGDWGDNLAFVNPDGSVVIVVTNRSDNAHPLALNLDGQRTGIVRIPARPFNTVIASGN